MTLYIEYLIGRICDADEIPAIRERCNEALIEELEVRGITSLASLAEFFV